MKKRTKRKRPDSQKRLAMIVILAVLVLAGIGIIAGFRIGHNKREEIEAIEQAQTEQEAAEEAARIEAIEAEKAAAEAEKAAQREEAARQAEREKTKELLAEQAKATNVENAGLIKDIAGLGIPNAGAYAIESALVPEEIAPPPIHAVCIDATRNGDDRFNLSLAFKLQSVLAQRGYQTVMTRSTEEAAPGQTERAAAGSGAEIMITIQTVYSDDPGIFGLEATVPAGGTPGLTDETVALSHRLASLILQGMTAASGEGVRGIAETPDLTADNWTTVPWGVYTAGFISNPEENARMSGDDYQNRLAEGMANGIDAYFAG